MLEDNICLLSRDELKDEVLSYLLKSIFFLVLVMVNSSSKLEASRKTVVMFQMKLKSSVIGSTYIVGYFVNNFRT